MGGYGKGLVTTMVVGCWIVSVSGGGGFDVWSGRVVVVRRGSEYVNSLTKLLKTIMI